MEKNKKLGNVQIDYSSNILCIERRLHMYKLKNFGNFARTIADYSGHPSAFLLTGAIVLIWLITGPLFSYSDTWQLVINTGSSIITFLMVFLIQNTQNRDSAA